MIFAEASNAFAGEWLYAATAVIGLLIAVGGYFATHREVDKLDSRIERAEAALAAIRAELKQDKEELIAVGERRSYVLHSRINPLIENTAALKASQEAFVTSFDNFTNVMKELVETLREDRAHRGHHS